MAGARAPKAAKPTPEAPDEAPQEAPVADPPAQEAPEPAPAPQEAVMRRYKATRAIGSTRRGEEFEATLADPRVKSGYVELLDGEANVPQAVKDALGG